MCEVREAAGTSNSGAGSTMWRMERSGLRHIGEAALRSWGFNCTPFGLSPAVFVPAAVRVVTSPPNFAKPRVV